MKQSPIFVKSFDVLTWVLNHTKSFPKHQRFVMAQRIEEAALSFQDDLVYATKTRDVLGALRSADYHLERLKLYNRLALKLRLHSFGQYEHLAEGLDELGRMLGGWIRSLDRPAAGRREEGTRG